MPRKRQPRELWAITREKVFARDGGKCVHCGAELSLSTCHIDHIRSGKLGSNHITNLRTLCKRCHILRLDQRHRGMIVKALKEEIIGPDWRDHLWEDDATSKQIDSLT